MASSNNRRLIRKSNLGNLFEALPSMTVAALGVLGLVEASQQSLPPDSSSTDFAYIPFNFLLLLSLAGSAVIIAWQFIKNYDLYKDDSEEALRSKDARDFLIDMLSSSIVLDIPTVLLSDSCFMWAGNGWKEMKSLPASDALSVALPMLVGIWAAGAWLIALWCVPGFLFLKVMKLVRFPLEDRKKENRGHEEKGERSPLLKS